MSLACIALISSGSTVIQSKRAVAKQFFGDIGFEQYGLLLVKGGSSAWAQGDIHVFRGSD